MSRVAVIGSGPAGAFCTRALMARGANITVLDVGERLDAATQEIVDRMRDLPAGEWPAADVAAIARNESVRRESIPFKLAFGSDYVYGADRAHSPQHGSGAIPTYALGGFSTVWGGAMLPMADADLAGWPIRSEELAAHYRLVGAHLPLVAEFDDGLSTVFPGHGPASALALPPQGSALVADLKAVRPLLAREGVLAGRSRLAVHAGADGSRPGCVQCGLCLTGCPTGAIYSSAPDIQSWTRAGRIAYRDGIVVVAVHESGGGVEVAFKSLDGRHRSTERFDQVFIAAGPVSTTRIVLNSLNLRNRTVTLLDSQKFLVPLLRRRPEPTALRVSGNVLASAFIEMLDPAISDHWVHVQVSPMNNLVLSKVGTWGCHLMAPLLARAMIGWGSLHSDDSGRIDVSLQDGGDGVLSVLPRAVPRTRIVVERAVAKLRRVARHIRSFVPPLGTRLGAIGRSAHIGGSFPMGRDASGLGSDLLGRPLGLKRVYLVDATTFPTIPGTTVALTVMANAHRIGSDAILQ